MANEEAEPTSQQNAGSSSDSGAELIQNISESVRPLITVRTEPFDPKPHTTRMRGWLALGMTFILLVTVIGSFLLASAHYAFHLTIEQVNGFAAPILSTEAALLGTALGFYFGDRST